MPRPRRLRTLLLRALALVVGLPLAAILFIILSTQPRRFNEAQQVYSRPVAIVFGAHVAPDGTLSPMLRDRVTGAVDLYKRGTVKTLLMTGDNSSPGYDEVSPMKAYAVSLGVPAKDISLDYAGFSTYESCYRAKQVFGVGSAVLVTQRYHLSRAVYTCRKLGVDAIGYGLPDFSLYPAATLRYAVREMGADLKAWWELNVTRPAPTFLGSSAQKS